MVKLLKVASLSSLLTLLKMGCGFLVAKIVAVYAGPSGIAMLGQLQSFVITINGVASAPLNSGLIRYTAENKKKELNISSLWWKACLYWCLWLCFITIPIVIVFASKISDVIFNNREYWWVIIAAGLFIPFAAIYRLINSVLNGMQDYKTYGIYGFISTLISTIILIILTIYYGLNGALLAGAIQTGILGLILFLLACREKWFRIKYWFGHVDSIYKKKVFNYLIMSICSAIATPVSMIFVRGILNQNVGWDITGQWQAVWKISEVYLSVITLSLSTYYLPKLSTIYGTENIRKEINATIKIIVPIVIILAMIIFLLKGFIIKTLFTIDFLPAVELFHIQLVGDIFKILGFIYAYPMLSCGATKWFISSELIFSFTLILLTFFIVPIYGVEGANIAYLINYIIYFVFVYMNFSKFTILKS